MNMQKEKQIVNKSIEAAMIKAFQTMHPQVQTKEDLLKVIRSK